MDQGYINHVALVIDSSGSMNRLKEKVIELVDKQIENLARISQQHDQETRVTVYLFGTSVECIFYDKDVLRLPSLRGRYQPYGLTALCSAANQAMSDLSQTATLYGDHAFLMFVITDGEENASPTHAKQSLKQRFASLPEDWTVAILVPNSISRHEAITHGFPAGNIETWDVSARGIEEVSERLSVATNAYMTMRSTGRRSTSNIFDLKPESVERALNQGALERLDPSKFSLLLVAPNTDGSKIVIKDYFQRVTSKHYIPGRVYYQLSKRELVQKTKSVAILDKKTGNVYVGDVARQMLKLPDADTRISPEDNPNYSVFIQSTSTNRHLVAGTQILWMK